MRRYLMSWVPATRRWAASYHYKPYAVSCKQLGCPETIEGSWRAANEWWKNKKREIDAMTPRPVHPHQAALNDLAEKVDWASSHAPKEVPALLAVMEETTVTPENVDPPFDDLRLIADNVKRFERESGINLPDAIPAEVLQRWFGATGIWRDRMERQPVAQIATNETLRYQADSFLATMKNKHKGKPGTWQDIATNVEAFINCPNVTTPTMPVSAVNEALFEDYYNAVQASNLSQDRKKSRMLNARRFVKWLWNRKLIELPRNLDSKELTVRITTKAVKIPHIDVVKEVLNKAEERLRLYILLMLNTGMTQADIADLRQEQINWDEGTITRQRVKTAELSNKVPTVTHWLWSETLELLKDENSGGDIVLLSERGTKLLERKFNVKTEKGGKKDLIQLAWKRWRDKPEGIQLKQLRKVASTMLEEHPKYGRYAQYFLGHAPNSTAGKHYVLPSAKNFKKALEWLGKQFGIR